LQHRKTHDVIFEKNGQAVRWVHKLLQRIMQGVIPTSTERHRKTTWKELSWMRLAYSSGSNKGKTSMDAVFQSRVPIERGKEEKN